MWIKQDLASRYPFLVSLALHLIVLLMVVLHIVLSARETAQDKPSPALDIAAYVYHPPVAAGAPNDASSEQQVMPHPTDAIPLKTVKQRNQHDAAKDTPPPTERDQSIDRSMAKQRDKEAIHLIGDKKLSIKPIIKLLGQALTAKLIYPRVAIDFNVKGTVTLGFVLQPDGALANIHLLRSSGADVLDQAALAAVHAISPLPNVATYVKSAEPMVIGIVFR